ncbi:MAG: AraC family transcriptional regulator, partial [Spirochaetes bacterium]|nr:AraC family transcriptional regulator [Spirochaetota bacterium]
MKHAKKFKFNSKAWKIISKEFGLNIDHILKKAQISKELMLQEEASLTAEEYFRLWTCSESFMEDKAFPLLLINKITADTFSPPVFAALSSPNMTIAMQRLAKYKKLVGPMRLDIESSDKFLNIKLGCLYTEQPIPSSLIAYELLYLVNLIRLGTRENIKPLKINTTIQLPSINKYENFFGVMPGKGNLNQITLLKKDALKPFLTESKRMWDFFEPVLAK